MTTLKDNKKLLEVLDEPKKRASAWGMEFNMHKCTVMLLSRQKEQEA
jgi:hypothetical protein